MIFRPERPRRISASPPRTLARSSEVLMSRFTCKFLTLLLAAIPSTVAAQETTIVVDQCPPTIRLYKQEQLVLQCECHERNTRGNIFGTDTYTDDSRICAAAVHAGVIDASGGIIRVTTEAGRDSYVGSTRNGVRSLDWPRNWPRSFRVQPATQVTKEISVSPSNSSTSYFDGESPEWWRGLWQGGNAGDRHRQPVSLFIGKTSWIRLSRSCRAELFPSSFKENTKAEFAFSPKGRDCPPEGKLTLNAKKTRQQPRHPIQETVTVTWEGDSRKYFTPVSKPVTGLPNSPYRYNLGSTDKRFLWIQPTGSETDTRDKLKDVGYKCLFRRTAELSAMRDSYDFRFENYGNVVGGFLAVLNCKGDCKGLSFTPGSSSSVYGQYLGNRFSTLAFLFESKTFFARTYNIAWQMPFDYETGQVTQTATVSAEVYSRDPADYGEGCR